MFDPMLTVSNSKQGEEGRILYDLELWVASITPPPREPQSLRISEQLEGKLS